MDVMVNSRTRSEVSDSGASNLKRLEFEMALELGGAGERPLAETVREAAESAGGDLLFVLPAPDGRGSAAVVRLFESGRSRLLQVRPAGSAFVVAEEPEIDADLLVFARASIDVLERLRDDRRVLAPLSSAAH